MFVNKNIVDESIYINAEGLDFVIHNMCITPVY